MKRQLREKEAKMTFIAPPAKVKENVLQHFHKKKAGVLYLYKMAAAACFLGMIVLAALLFNQKDNETLMSKSVEAKSKKVQEGHSPMIGKKAEGDLGNEKVSLAVAARTGSKKVSFVKPKKVKQQSQTQTILQQFQNSYGSFIEEQKMQLNKMPIYASVNMLNHYREALNRLDEQEAIINSLISVNGMNQIYLDQLITCYQDKLALLTNLKIEVQQVNSRVIKDSILIKEPLYIDL
jgi:hypothetical protein